MKNISKPTNDKKSHVSLCKDIRHKLRYGNLNPLVETELTAKYQFLSTNGLWIGSTP